MEDSQDKRSISSYLMTAEWPDCTPHVPELRHASQHSEHVTPLRTLHLRAIPAATTSPASTTL